jgi:hypothetical protein
MDCAGCRDPVDCPPAPFVVSDWNHVFVHSMRSIRKWLRACAQQAFVASCILFPLSHVGQALRWLALRSHRLSQPTDWETGARLDCDGGVWSIGVRGVCPALTRGFHGPRRSRIGREHSLGPGSRYQARVGRIAEDAKGDYVTLLHNPALETPRIYNNNLHVRYGCIYVCISYMTAGKALCLTPSAPKGKHGSIVRADLQPPHRSHKCRSHHIEEWLASELTFLVRLRERDRLGRMQDPSISPARLARAYLQECSIV